MKKKLTDNLGLKVLALLFSVVLWLIVMNIDDPVISKPFKDIPVKIINAEAVTSEDKVYEVLDGTDEIDITVYAKRSILNTITRDSIVAVADMEELTFMNTVRISLSTNENNDKLEDIKSTTENLKLNIEDLKRVQIVIETQTVGKPGEGFLLGDVNSDQNLVRLSGPESLISKVDKAVVEVKVEGITSSIQADFPLKLYDAEGHEIDDKSITKSVSNIRVTASILQQKQVPIGITVSGTPNEGYGVTGEVICNPETVLIAGRSAVVKNINEITIPPEVISVTGQSADLQQVLDITEYLPDNVFLADSDFNGKVSITVSVEKKEAATIEIDKNKIVIQNMPAGFQGHIGGTEEPLSIIVSGLPDNMTDIENKIMTGYIDVNDILEKSGRTELTVGNYNAEVQITLPEGVTAAEKMVVVLSVEKEES